MMFFNTEEVDLYENDLSAEKEAEGEDPRIQEEDEHERRQEGFGRKEKKRKKEIMCIGHRTCGLSS